MSRRGWVLFALMSAIWGLPYLLIRVAVGELPPAAVVLVRVGLATLVLFPICVARGLGRTVWPALRRWRPLLAYTVIEIAVPWLLLSSAERSLTSSLAGILVAATALVAAVLGWVLRADDQLDPGRATGLVIGFGGVLALVGIDLGTLSFPPLFEVAGVVLCYAVGPVVLARWLADLPAIGVVTASVGLTAVGYLPVVVFGPPVAWSSIDAATALALVVLAVICTAAAFLAFFALIAEAGPARAVVITYVNPAVAVALGVLVLGEHITVGMAVGFPLILVGCVLGARRSRAAPPGRDAVRPSRLAAAGPGRPGARDRTLRMTGTEIVHPVAVEHLSAFVRLTAATYFDDPETPERLRHWRARTWSPDRTWAAQADGRLVATLRTRAETVSVPGATAQPCPQVPADLLTSVTVSATHRRQGLLTRMLTASLTEAHERGDALSILVAAEWLIYGRFGYAPAVFERTTRLDLQAPGVRSGRATAGAGGGPGEVGQAVRQVEAEDVEAFAPALYAAEQRIRAGLIGRGPQWWDLQLGRVGENRSWAPTSAQGAARHVVHEGPAGVDGYVRWNQDRTQPSGPVASVVVEDFLATDPTARAALFGYLRGLDLVGPVTLPGRPVDDDLRWLLPDGRALQTVAEQDAMWVRILDVGSALSARRYAVDGILVLDVFDDAPGGWATGRYRLDGGAAGATCTPAAGAKADVTMPQSTLAAIYFGGVRAAALARVGRLDEHTPGALARLDAMFATGLAPWRATDF